MKTIFVKKNKLLKKTKIDNLKNKIKIVLKKKKLFLKIRNIKNKRIFSRKKFTFFNSNFIANYIKKNMKKSNIKYIIRKILKMIKSYNYIMGVKFILSGRLNKMSRSKPLIFQKGSIGSSYIDSPLDYSNNSFITKYGIIGLKIYVSYKNFNS